jgi:uncharacterized RDD family membrane protein YckC
MSMPEGGAAGEQDANQPQSGAAGNQWTEPPPSAPRPGGQPGQPPGGQPAQQGGRPGQPPATGTQGAPPPEWRQEWGTGPAGARPAGAGPQGPTGLSPVPEQETRVTGRRFFQFIIDGILAGIIPSLVFWLVHSYTHGVVKGLAWLIAAAVWVVIMLWYWVIRPYGANGQTFGMQWLGIRIVGKDGGPANMTQLFIRWLLLIPDHASGILAIADWIVILCSRYRQRVGDHVAKTLVVRADSGFGSTPGRHSASAGMTRPDTAGLTGTSTAASPAGTSSAAGPAGTSKAAGPGR